MDEVDLELGQLPRTLPDRAAAEALFAPIAGEAVEVAVFAYLGEDQRLLGIRHARSAFADNCQLPIRDVAADALSFDARGVVMAHNHPRGDPAPSPADHDATRRLARALESLDVRLVDHLVIASGGSVSFRSLGLL